MSLIVTSTHLLDHHASQHLKNCVLREGTFFVIGGGGPGLRRGGSFVNILQIGEGQTCFICSRGRVIVFWPGKKFSMSAS